MGALDDLRSQIKIRGFVDRFADPVTEFEGRFGDKLHPEKAFDIVAATFNNVATGRSNIVMHFEDIDSSSVVSTEPYPFPNKDISISYSESKQSRWVIFSDSLVKFLAENETFEDAIGRRMHLKMVSHTMYQGKDESGKDKRGPTPCWEVVGMEGASTTAPADGKAAAGTVSAEKQLLVLLNGRSEQQFNMEVLRLPAVKSDSSLTTRILNRTFFSEIISKGLISKDEAGVYTLTESGVAALQS